MGELNLNLACAVPSSKFKKNTLAAMVLFAFGI